MNGISAQGTRVTRNGVDIAGLSDVVPPPLTRKAVDDTRHFEADERFEVGIRRAGLLEFDIDFPDADDLLTAWENDQTDAYVVIFADGAEWTFDGKVVDVSPKAAVEGRLVAHVAIRPTAAVDVGGELLLLENGGRLLLEDDGRIIL